MKRTRLQELLFSNTNEEIANQVDNDIKSAQENGVVDTDELKYEHVGNGDVAITDKETGEVTVAQKATDEADTYDLIAVPDGQLEKFLHPSADGKPGDQVGAPDEDIHDHLEGNNEEQHEFSVSTDNTAVLRIFSDQVFCERIFSEVIESEETAKVGDLKIEKVDDEAVVVTDLSSGDQAKVEFDGDEMEVTELDSKEFSGEDLDGDGEGFLPYHVVGIQAFDHLLVDSPAWTLEDAQELQRRLEEDNVDAVRIFDNQADARDYAMSLLDGTGAEEVGEPVEQEYSDTSIYVTPYENGSTLFMDRAFSEATSGIADLQDDVENAIADGDEIETDDEIITPIDAINAVIEDKNTGEFTKATISGNDLLLRAIDEDDAEDLLDGLSVVEECPECEDEEEEEGIDEESEEEDEERDFSDIEDFTDFMIRLYSEESDQDAIEDAIESGDEIETDEDIITPVDNSTAVVEDKNSGEYTKVVLVDDNGTLNLHPISEEEAESLLENIVVEEEGIDEESEEEDEERDFSDIYWDETETKFFSEYEDFTDYMMRLYSDEADQEDVEKAIANGEQIETDDEVITPVDATTAVVEDKESEEFTKVTLDEEGMNVEKIDEDEADELTDGLAVEEEGIDDDKKFSYAESATLDKFFADIAMAQAPEGTPTVVNENGNEVPVAVGENGEIGAAPAAPTVEEAEDKAEAAIQSIQAAAAEAAAMIADAKAAPAPNQEPDLQETQFSDTNGNDTLVSWLEGIKY